MKVTCWALGKTEEAYLREGVETYRKRITHYLPFQWRTLDLPKRSRKAGPEQQRELEAETVLRNLQPGDWLVLLDEGGKRFSSEGFARHLERRLQHSATRLVFLIGGPWGFAPSLYQRADEKLSLSPMTFSHQMVRVFFLEQLYRALTILRNEPYHHR